MVRIRLTSSVLALALVFMSTVLSNSADAQSTDSNESDRAKTGYQFSYTPIYQFETDLDSSGQFDVQRHFLRFDVSRSIDQNWTVGLGLSFDYERWNFSDITGLAGVDLWDEIFRPGISLPLFYNTGNKWMFGIIPSIEASGATGAEVSESLSFGAVLSASYVVRPTLILGLGVGIFNELDESRVFPFVVINWQINDRLRLTNPFRAGPTGPAGLELVYEPADAWKMGIGSAYRSYRFRLDDSSAVADGIGGVDFWAPFVRVGRQIGNHYSIDVYGGALVNGSITIDDQNSNELGETDYDTAPFAGLTIQGQF